MAENETTVHVLNPDFQDIHPEAKYVNYVYTGNDSVREYRVLANSKPTAGVNPGRVTFNAKLTPGEMLDRCVMVEYTIKVSIQGHAADPACTFGKINGLCLAAYPISRCCSQLNVKLNSYGESVSPWEYIGAYNHTLDSQELRRMCSFPAQPDNYNNITAMTYTGGARVNIATKAISSNTALGATVLDIPASPDSPFAGTSGAGFDQPRNLFPPTKITFTPGVAANPGANPPVVAVLPRLDLEYTITEVLPHPFFRHTDGKSMLARILNMDVDMTFGSLNAAFVNAQDLIKSYTNAAGTASGDGTVINISFDEDAYLIYRTYAPNTRLKPVFTARYNRLVVMKENVPVSFSTAGQSVSMNSRAMVFSHVPEKLFIFARPRQQFADTTSPEAFLRIDNLTIRTPQNSGNLNGATNAQLFQMSARNGLTMSYNKFARDIGSIIIVDLKRGDLGAHIPGTAGNFQIDLSLKLTNTQFTKPYATQFTFFDVPDAVGNPLVIPPPQYTDWDLFVIATVPSKLVLDGTSGYSSFGEDTSEVLRALAEDPMHMVNDESRGLGGKSGWQKFLHGIGQVLGLVKEGVNTAQMVRGALGRGLGDELADSNYGSGVISGGAVRTGGALRTLR